MLNLNLSPYLILLLLGMASMPRAMAQDIQELRKGVVKIVATQVSDGQSKTRRGSGFIVQLYPDAATIVTASHVVEGQDIQLSVEFSVRGDASFPAQVKRMRGGDARGLAVLVVKNPPPGLLALELTTSPALKLSDDVVAAGFPRISSSFSALSGKVVSRDGEDIIFSGGPDEGSSGGPLLKNGKVVGVVTQARDGNGFATPALILAATLEGWGFTTKQADNAPAAAQPQPEAARTRVRADSANPDLIYPETADGLKRFFEAMLDAAKSGDMDKAHAFEHSLVIPNFDTWFRHTFGAVNGAKLSAEYKVFTEGQKISGLWNFPELIERAKGGVSTYGIRAPTDPNATGGQKKVFAAMEKSTALYGVRLGGWHVWSFVYVEGGFRLAGKMYQSLPNPENR
jgi:Trypsin-like peptidase domain